MYLHAEHALQLQGRDQRVLHGHLLYVPPTTVLLSQTHTYKHTHTCSSHATHTRHPHNIYSSISFSGLGPGYPHRRLDLKAYPREQFPFAVLYFTGSDYFNRCGILGAGDGVVVCVDLIFMVRTRRRRSMRCYAIQRKGWSLSDKAMGPAM